MDKDQSCGGVCWGAGISVLEFDDGGLDLLSVGCVEGDVARGEGFQSGGFDTGFLGSFGEGFSRFYGCLDLFPCVCCGQLEFFVGPLGFQRLGEAVFCFLEGHLPRGLGFYEVENVIGFVADDGIAGGLRVRQLECCGHGAWSLVELLARFAKRKGLGDFDLKLLCLREAFEVCIFLSCSVAELAGSIGQLLEGFSEFAPREFFFLVGEVEMDEAHLAFFWGLEGGLSLFVGLFDLFVRHVGVFRERVACETDDGGFYLLMLFRVGLHEFGFGGLGGCPEKVFDAVHADAVPDEFFKVLFGHPARPERHLHVEFVAIVVELPLILEGREFLDCLNDLFFGGSDAELAGFLTENDGVPHEGVGAVLRGVRAGCERDEEFEHPEDAAQFEVASEAKIFEGGDVPSCDSTDTVGAEFVHAGSWTAVEDDEGHDDDDREGGQEGFLEAPEKVDHKEVFADGEKRLPNKLLLPVGGVAKDELMRLRFPPRWSQSLFGLLGGVMVAISSTTLVAQQPAAQPAAGQPVGEGVTLVDGRFQPGQVVGSDGKTVQLKGAIGVIGLPMAQVASVRTNPPPQLFTAPMDVVRAGDLVKAMPLFWQVYEKFRGVPVEWMSTVFGFMIDGAMMAGDKGMADRVKSEVESFPKLGELTGMDMVLAQADFVSGRFPDAEGKIKPVIEKALADRTLGQLTPISAQYAKALNLSGRILEGQGRESDAYERYLQVTLLFSGDATAVKFAKERIGVLQTKGVKAP